MGKTGVEMQIMMLDPINTHEFWPKIVPLLERGRKAWERYTDLENIKKDVRSGKYILWVSANNEEYKAVMLTEFVDYPRVRVLRIVHISGTMIIKELIDKIDLIFEWGKSRGVQICEIHGSPAWAKLLTKTGHYEYKAVLHKDLRENS